MPIILVDFRAKKVTSLAPEPPLLPPAEHPSIVDYLDAPVPVAHHVQRDWRAVGVLAFAAAWLFLLTRR